MLFIDEEQTAEFQEQLQEPSTWDIFGNALQDNLKPRAALNDGEPINHNFMNCF